MRSNGFEQFMELHFDASAGLGSIEILYICSPLCVLLHSVVQTDYSIKLACFPQRNAINCDGRW